MNVSATTSQRAMFVFICFVWGTTWLAMKVGIALSLTRRVRRAALDHCRRDHPRNPPISVVSVSRRRPG